MLPRMPSAPMGQPEPAIKKVYDPVTGSWQETEVMISFCPEAFASGTLRKIYRMTDHTNGNADICGKLSKDPNEPTETYYMDVKMQCKAKSMADMYNAGRPPKPIGFVVPWVVEFKRRTAPNGFGRLVVNAEPFLPGKYIKHSNNYGFVSREDRNSPAAFSHFSHHVTNGQLLVCDIQGVGDVFTDPQIHSRGRCWGKADLGEEGMQRFFHTHKCNAICEFLGLPPLSGKKKKISFRSVFPPERPIRNAVAAPPPAPPSAQLVALSSGKEVQALGDKFSFGDNKYAITTDNKFTTMGDKFVVLPASKDAAVEERVVMVSGTGARALQSIQPAAQQQVVVQQVVSSGTPLTGFTSGTPAVTSLAY